MKHEKPAITPNSNENSVVNSPIHDKGSEVRTRGPTSSARSRSVSQHTKGTKRSKSRALELVKASSHAKLMLDTDIKSYEIVALEGQNIGKSRKKTVGRKKSTTSSQKKKTSLKLHKKAS